ncbi:Rossmann-like alpha-beta-alpha sandwich fold [Babesia duncani]|uniref:Rossmann-like alpha-beta-alpha sandwich fold n=1 Tax=Babesia duncani TaxID=323732 RepID=A0AAD9UQ16_9APIC|nr:Rossmann-like alpha-beta-alpha sandwich fold [Babesia duncani]
MEPSQCLELIVTAKDNSYNFNSIHTVIKNVNEAGYLEQFFEFDADARLFELQSDLFIRDSLIIDRQDCKTSCSVETQKYHALINAKVFYELCPLCFIAIYGNVHCSLSWLHEEICGNSTNVIDTLHSLKGSFALVYISLGNNCIYILKDELGLKSLLISFEHENTIRISNVATDFKNAWYDVHPLLSIAIGTNASLFNRCKSSINSLCLRKCPALEHVKEILSTIEKVNSSLVESILHLCKQYNITSTACVLFSGGVDSGLIAALLARHVKVECIELINVVFKNTNAPDRITAILTYQELIKSFPNVNFRLVCIDVNDDEYKKDEAEILKISFPNTTRMDLNIAASLYYACTLDGYIFPSEFLTCDSWLEFIKSNQASRALNLSVTVSKRKRGPNGQSIPSNGHGDCFNKIDETALEHDFDTSCIEREYVFLEIIKFDSLSAFASVDMSNDACIQESRYKSQCQHLFLGSGADELFGGYARHVSIEIERDPNFCMQEINRDLLRLWKRNLGRDDRIVNFRNKVALYPFLNQEVIYTLGLHGIVSNAIDLFQCPEWFKQLRVYGMLDVSRLRNAKFVKSNRIVYLYINKWVLRELCLGLGLVACARFKKRAIQFGSKSAKVFNRLLDISNRIASSSGPIQVDFALE